MKLNVLGCSQHVFSFLGDFPKQVLLFFLFFWQNVIVKLKRQIVKLKEGPFEFHNRPFEFHNHVLPKNKKQKNFLRTIPKNLNTF